ncbi:helix-turn-helix transcriptional regulator [Elizabethkingia anophelis]|uniref:helix-turn-helix transcriptional regulator n=1 Tax=Elizabethkingia anophelis TaxID=1117645 RepID=UPI0024076A4D|nr:helix-turn-helix transcriptional regulator [Elizabethkingia anophelis]
MELKIKEACKRYGVGISELADKIGITRQALNTSLKNNPTAERLTEIAKAINCDIHEIIGVTDEYYHLYDDKTGEWLGIRKK